MGSPHEFEYGLPCRGALMSMANFLVMTTKDIGILARARRQPTTGLGRALTILVLIAVACGSAKAQYIGFSANSASGTVSAFAVATSTSGTVFGGNSSPFNQDHIFATLIVCANPVRIAATPPSQNFNGAYVTCQDNSLWALGVTSSQGTLGGTNVNPAANPLGLSQPGGIAIVHVPTGANAGKVFAFIANQGKDTVSVVDTSNNLLWGTVTLGSTASGTSTTIPEVAATSDGTQVFVTNNSTANCSPASSTPCPGVFMIDATSVAGGTSSVTSISVSGGVGNTFAATAAQLTNNVATLNVASANTLFTVGQPILVSSFTGNDTYFNGTFNVASISSTQVTYNDIHANGVATTNGTVTNAVVLSS